MIPILFDKSETAFQTNGIGRLSDCIECEVTEERNGIYELRFVYPVTGRHYEDITEGRIVYCLHDDTGDLQPFDIYRRGVTIDGTVTFYAHHISYRLGNIILNPFTASSCAEAFGRMVSNSINTNPFTFWTDKDVTGTFSVTAPVSVKAILGGMEGSILDVYGKADYEWDKWTVKLYQNRGQNNHVQIRYGKNLTQFIADTDTSGIYNAVVPYWSDGEGSNTVMLPERIITYDGIPTGSEVIPAPMDLSDVWETAPTEEQLRTTAQTRLNNSDAWHPNLNIDIDFIQLWQMPEYEQFTSLQRCALCDTVTIICPELGVDEIEEKVIAVTYDVLNEKYTRMSLGNPRVTFGEQTIAEITSEIAGEYPTMSAVQNALTAATNRISGVNGGYVRYMYDADGNPTELLIMDAPDINNAVNIVRMNVAGIAFSNSGYAPERFTTAWTIDGSFVADFITAGTLNANLLTAGTIMDSSGRSWWNLTNGSLHLALAPSDIGAVSTSEYENGIANMEDYADNAVESLQNNIQLYFHADSDGVRIGKTVGDQETPYSILLTNEKMSFQQYGFEVAYIQYNILHINNVEILDRMTLGDATYGGYFDWIVTDAGIGVKWRGV